MRGKSVEAYLNVAHRCKSGPPCQITSLHLSQYLSQYGTVPPLWMSTETPTKCDNWCVCMSTGKIDGVDTERRCEHEPDMFAFN